MQRRDLFRTASAMFVVCLAGCGGGGAFRPSGSSGPTVLGVARANGLVRFVRAAEASGVAETLAGPGPFTVFAPTDRAFAASDASRLDADDLRDLVAYHVVPGLLTTDFLDGVDVNHTTLQGSSLNTDGADGLRVNGAAVTRADLLASNGVVFAIDRVLTPR